MAKVVGLGGVFFKSKDAKALGEWYKKWLGVPYGAYGANFMVETIPAGGLAVWSPFKDDTNYFAPSDQAFMINLMVDDIDGALKQVAEGGATVLPERENADYGRFGWFIDPDGNKVELWQPLVAVTSVLPPAEDE